MKFDTHTPETASPEASTRLEGAKAKYGFVPNLMAIMAEAPATLEAYQTLAGLFDKTSLSPTERQVVLLTVSRANGCDYCMAAHSMIAKMQSVPEGVVAAVRDDQPIADAKLEALRRFAAAVTQTRGRPSGDDLAAFEGAGYGSQQALEVVLGVTFKTLSNYTNHLADTPLDEAFAPAKWSAPAGAAGATG